MSYNSSKGPINIGDLINEDDPDTLIDWESDKIVFKTNSTKRFVIDNNEISGSGAAVIVGNTVLGGTLKVSGSTTLAGPSTLGNAASDVTTLTGQVTASAGVLLSSTLDVGGNTSLGNAASDTVIIAGGLTASHGVLVNGYDGIVVNNQAPISASIFKHSDGSTRMSISSTANGITMTGSVQAGNDFTVLGNTTLGNAASDVTTLTGQVTASAGVLLSSTLDVGGNTSLGNAATDTVSITGKTTVMGNLSASLGVTGSLLLSTGSTAQVAVGVKSPVATNMLYVSTIDNDNRVPLLIVDTTEKILLAVSGSGKVVVGGKGAPYIDGLLNITGSESEKLITIKSDIKNPVFYVKGDGDTFVSGALMIQDTHPTLHFSSSAGTGLGAVGYNSSDNIVIQNNVVNKHIVFKTSDAGVLKEGFRIDGAVPEVVVNQGSDSLIDFRVESNGNTHMFFVDGSANKVGIDTNAPEVKLDINDNAIRIRNSSTPSSAGDFGVAGEIRWDANYIYVCTATDTWKRVAISTW